ncbi:MAG: methyltransferase domain-containing protein [Alphaproteobacteria bacterium]|nr:methyltransferase domain-containing protein [Alphaproteobacteria bacterium]MCB9931605.1 methyltransferase domain-containing protein [Alphaproteobacteria bacterium]
MSLEALETNYSRLGSALIERLYDTDSVLSLSGLEATDRLAAEAAIAAESRVLDIGCGLGGPALRLAETRGCQVTGVDLVQTNVETALTRAEARGLADQVGFRQGDAQDLPFADDSFDVIFSQDALCHVPAKVQAVAEAVRLVRPGGRIAFTDWVETGPMVPAMQETVLDALASENLAAPAQYRDWLGGRGCEVLVQEDISAVFAARYRSVMDRLAALEGEISSRFSPRVYQIMAEKNGALLEAFDAGTLGGVLMVAEAP